ncbi:MAG: SDR family NAD(P)-dependent oxidoreductase [Acidobacteriota bacterium]
MTSLAMKRVLITGAAQGIGRAIAEAFASENAELVLTDINQDALDAARSEIHAATGARCRAYRLDVTDPASIADARDRIHRDAGRIDILINNAGTVFGGAFADLPLERHRLTYRINVEGTVAVTHAFYDDLLRAPRGHLVFIASASGFIGLPNATTYASSKWAVIGFAESIRAELKHQGVRSLRVTTVCPGYVDTGLFDGAAPVKTTRMLTPAELGQQVTKAVKNGDVWVLEPWIVKFTPLLKHGLPTALSDFLSDAFGASSSMNAWTGHGDDATGGDPRAGGRE